MSQGMKGSRYAALLFLLLTSHLSRSQVSTAFADSIRKASHIPELAIAVVSSSSILQMQVMGEKRIQSGMDAEMTDRFRIGSNTKAITGLIAARLVKAGKIGWDTKLFSLFPEWERQSREEYQNLSLLDLLTFRTRLQPYTYTDKKPKEDDFAGGEEEQRKRFVQWALKQKPVKEEAEIHFSNTGYVAAGLMLERVSGKSYRELVKELGDSLHISFGFGAPNTADSLQPWGHDNRLNPEKPGGNAKLDWLLSAGNINVSLPDYVRFIQLQLQGLKGESALLSQAEFEFLHYGRESFAVGWFWNYDDSHRKCSFNTGNPGTFLSMVFICPDKDIGIVLFCNVQSEIAGQGMRVLMEALQKEYLR